MNRKERRKTARIRNDETRVPVMCGENIIELAGPERLHFLLKAPNVEAITRRRDRKIVELQVREFGNDSARPSTGGNASTNSDCKGTDVNPRGVWKFRRLRKAS